VKVDIDRKPHLAERYGVSAVPTLMLFSGGSPVLTLRGARSFEELSRAIEPHLPAGN
jgi:thioredoxin 1